MVILEYHNIASPTEQPVYSDFAIGLLFACECIIPGRDQPFGGKENGFSTKKAARTNAAREAVEFLISAGLLNEDGSIKSRKKAKPGSTVKFESNALRVEKSATYSQRVSGNYFIAFNYPPSLLFTNLIIPQTSAPSSASPPQPTNSAPPPPPAPTCSPASPLSPQRSASLQKSEKFAMCLGGRMPRRSVRDRCGRS